MKGDANIIILSIKFSVTMPDLVPQRHLSVLNFFSVTQPQKFWIKTFDEQSR